MASTDYGSTDTGESAAGTGGATGRIPQARSSQYEAPPQVSGWIGWIVFAGAMLLMAGMFQATWGLVALFRNNFFTLAPNGLVIFDFTAWGWIYLILGGLLALVGAALLTGQQWARWPALFFALLSALSNFASMNAYPFWSITMIVIDVFVIFALAVHGKDLAAATR